MAVRIAGRQFWLWRPVDDESEVLSEFAQPTGLPVIADQQRMRNFREVDAVVLAHPVDDSAV
jgi:hypothetical protein